MQRITLRIFQKEVERQCQFALMSIWQLNGALEAYNQQNMGSAHMRSASDRLWYSLQNFLIASANISKLLWGTPSNTKPEIWKRRKKDRLELRKSLGVADNSILKLSPEFRNHFEHLDERLEEWADTSQRHNLVADLIGSTAMISGIDSEDYLRSYDPVARQLGFRGETFEIQPVVQAIEALLPRAQTEANTPHGELPQWDRAGGGG